MLVAPATRWRTRNSCCLQPTRLLPVTSLNEGGGKADRYDPETGKQTKKKQTNKQTKTIPRIQRKTSSCMVSPANSGSRSGPSSASSTSAPKARGVSLLAWNPCLGNNSHSLITHHTQTHTPPTYRSVARARRPPRRSPPQTPPSSQSARREPQPPTQTPTQPKQIPE